MLTFMKSDGGLTPVDDFSGESAILSGPAGGVIGYAKTAFRKTVGSHDDIMPVIGFDMGGTSTDVSRYDGSLELVFETTTAGVAIQAPQLDINTVAAGDDSSPDTITYNSVINCHASSGHINAAKAAERVLKKMEIASKTNPAVVPNTLTYNQVLKAYSTSKLPGGTNRADVILRYMMMSRNKNIEPDSFSFTTCLNIWAKSKEPGKAEKAYAILNKMLEAYRLTGKDQMRPNEITYNTVLNACAFSAYTPNEEKKKALSIAVSIFNEMHKSDIVQPDAVSYGNMLKCIANLVPKGEVRNKMAVDVFTKCRNLGLVNGLVFDEIRRAVPADVLTDPLSEAMKRRRGKKLFSEWELRDLPHSWKSKVHEMKPKKREPRKSKKDSSTTVAVEVAEGTNMNGTIRPMRTIVETSWQSGRDV